MCWYVSIFVPVLCELMSSIGQSMAFPLMARVGILWHECYSWHYVARILLAPTLSPFSTPRYTHTHLPSWRILTPQPGIQPAIQPEPAGQPASQQVASKPASQPAMRPASQPAWRWFRTFRNLDISSSDGETLRNQPRIEQRI